MKNKIPIYQNQAKGLPLYLFKQMFSRSSMNRHAYVRANIVPMAVPNFSCLILPLNLKKMFFKINLIFLARSLVEIFYMSFFFRFLHVLLVLLYEE